MRSSTIMSIKGREILDSRGYPTLEVDILLSNGMLGTASVPSGASRGVREAVEKRDDNPNRFAGKGVQNCLHLLRTDISDLLIGQDALNQGEIDRLLLQLDGTEQKSHLGANTILSCSMAVSCAGSACLGVPLYRYFSGCFCSDLPVPMINVLNGGVHADNELAFQEFMLVPLGASSFSEALRRSCEVTYVLKTLLKRDGYGVNVGDEGGFAPSLSDARDALNYLVEAVQVAGFSLFDDFCIAMDCAASNLRNDSGDYLVSKDIQLSAEKMVDYYEDLLRDYPIISLEDPLAEDDWAGWRLLTERLSRKVMLVGDDLFVTQQSFLQKGIDLAVANAILLKPNQVGTLTETFETARLATIGGYGRVMSHRSGETESHFLADLAVGMGVRWIKTGGLSRSERIAKYNRLLRIEEELGSLAVYSGTYMRN